MRWVFTCRRNVKSRAYDPSLYWLLPYCYRLHLMHLMHGQRMQVVVSLSHPLPMPWMLTPATGFAKPHPAMACAHCGRAVQEANALSGSGTIPIPAGIYVLSIAGQNEDLAATGDLDIRRDITITGAGNGVTVIDGGAIDRVFHIRLWAGGGWFTSMMRISGVTIRNGYVGSLEKGGGIHNSGATLVISDSVISGKPFVWNLILTVVVSTVTEN